MGKDGQIYIEPLMVIISQGWETSLVHFYLHRDWSWLKLIQLSLKFISRRKIFRVLFKKKEKVIGTKYETKQKILDRKKMQSSGNFPARLSSETISFFSAKWTFQMKILWESSSLTQLCLAPLFWQHLGLYSQPHVNADNTILSPVKQVRASYQNNEFKARLFIPPSNKHC